MQQPWLMACARLSQSCAAWRSPVCPHGRPRSAGLGGWVQGGPEHAAHLGPLGVETAHPLPPRPVDCLQTITACARPTKHASRICECEGTQVQTTGTVQYDTHPRSPDVSTAIIKEG